MVRTTPDLLLLILTLSRRSISPRCALWRFLALLSPVGHKAVAPRSALPLRLPKISRGRAQPLDPGSQTTGNLSQNL